MTLNGMTWSVKKTGIDVGTAYSSDDKNVKFKWQAYNLDTKKWSRIADWNGGNWATWKPQPGNYWLHVEAANGDGGFDEQTICFAVSTDFSKNYIDLNGIAMIDKSSLYQVGVTYSSNDSDVQFRWLQYDVVNNHWSLVSDWNKSNWTNWYPKMEHIGYMLKQEHRMGL